jgi:serine protease Do
VDRRTLGGIRAGDIVLAVEGHLILGLSGFTASLYQHPTGQALKIDVLRGTQNLSLDIPTVLALDRIDRLAELADPMSSRIEPLGIFGLNFDEELRPTLWNVRLGRGVIVVGQAPGFNSVDTRLQPGDLIHALNGTPIESVEQLKSVVAQLKPGHAAVLRIERQGQFQYVPFEME